MSEEKQALTDRRRVGGSKEKRERINSQRVQSPKKGRVNPKKPMDCFRDLGTFSYIVLLGGKGRNMESRRGKQEVLKSSLFTSVGYRMDLRIRIRCGRKE